MISIKKTPFELVQSGKVIRSSFPWQEAMSFGFGYMKLSSKDFWNLTPRELHAAMTFAFPAQSDFPHRKAIDDLMSVYPDRQGFSHE